MGKVRVVSDRVAKMLVQKVYAASAEEKAKEKLMSRRSSKDNVVSISSKRGTARN